MTLTSVFDTPHSATITAATTLPLADGTHIYVLRIAVPSDFSYRAGQYVNLGFAALEPRPYSIASAPSANAIEVHIKKTAGIVGTHLSAVMRVGDTVRLSAAQGESVFIPADKRPLVLIAGGMGFTPIKAIIEAALLDDPQRQIDFFWGTQHAGDRYLDDYFADKAAHYDGFRYHPVTATPVGEHAARTLPDLRDKRIYVAGPPPMISAILPLLIHNGAERSLISYDRQTPRLSSGTPQNGHTP